MAMLAQEARASVATVTLAQTLRVLVVVLAFPPLMGWIGSEFGARWSVAVGGIVVLLTGLAAVIVVSRRNSMSFRDNLRIVFRRRREPAV